MRETLAHLPPEPRAGGFRARAGGRRRRRSCRRRPRRAAIAPVARQPARQRRQVLGRGARHRRRPRRATATSPSSRCATTAIGIPRDEQEKIFDRFHRVSTGLVHDVKGSGLGLAIVRHIVEAHGGRIEVESRPGEGSTLPHPAAARPAVATPLAPAFRCGERSRACRHRHRLREPSGGLSDAQRPDRRRRRSDVGRPARRLRLRGLRGPRWRATARRACARRGASRRT